MRGYDGSWYANSNERIKADNLWLQQEKQNKLIKEQNDLIRKQNKLKEKELNSNSSSSISVEPGPITIGDRISITLFVAIITYGLVFLIFGTDSQGREMLPIGLAVATILTVAIAVWAFTRRNSDKI